MSDVKVIEPDLDTEHIAEEILDSTDWPILSYEKVLAKAVAKCVVKVLEGSSGYINFGGRGEEENVTVTLSLYEWEQWIRLDLHDLLVTALEDQELAIYTKRVIEKVWQELEAKYPDRGGLKCLINS